jgi:hypothetical protein
MPGSGAPTDGSAWESVDGSNRVNRGGAWNHHIINNNIMLKIFTLKYEEKSESFNDLSMSNFLSDKEILR